MLALWGTGRARLPTFRGHNTAPPPGGRSVPSPARHVCLTETTLPQRQPNSSSKIARHSGEYGPRRRRYPANEPVLRAAAPPSIRLDRARTPPFRADELSEPDEEGHPRGTLSFPPVSRQVEVRQAHPDSLRPKTIAVGAVSTTTRSPA